MSDEKIRRAAEILKEAYDKHGDKDLIIEGERGVLSRYGQIFTSRNIGDLKWEEFTGFLDYDNNGHWKGIDLQVKMNRTIKEEFEDKIKPALANLLDETFPIEDRIERCFKIKGIWKATITPILLVAFPEKYGVWNSVSEWALKTLGLWLENYPEKSTGHISDGKVYRYINETLNKLSKKMGVDLWTLDAIFYYYSQNNSDQMCVELKVGEKYSRKDLCDLFSPEFKFGTAFEKVGITGVIPFDLGLRKDYGLLAVTDKSTDRKRQEVVQEDGTFEWITQQRIKNKETPLAKRLKCETDSQIHLFLKKTIREEDFTYWGLLEFIQEYRDEKGDRRFIYKIKSWESNGQDLRVSGSAVIVPLIPTHEAKLNSVDPPSFGPGPERSGSGPSRHRSRSHDVDDAENKRLGRAGELLVMEFEKEKLADKGLEPKHIARCNDGAGYDIESYEISGEEIFIEVKTTRGGKDAPFFISENEYRVSKEKGSKYRLYRLFDFHPNTGAKFYVKNGSMEGLSPSPYKYIVKVRT